MGLFDDVALPSLPKAQTLSWQGTQLLKKKRKKTRRGSGIKKKTVKQTQHQRDMELYKKQKRARGEMFEQFKRLIGE